MTDLNISDFIININNLSMVFKKKKFFSIIFGNLNKILN